MVTIMASKRELLKPGFNPRLAASADTIAYRDIDVTRIIPNDDQPRSITDRSDHDIESLAANISRCGLLNPITVIPMTDGTDRFKIVAGHRRFAAIQRLGWNRISVTVIRSADEKTAFMMSLYENTLRRQMTPEDIGRAYIRMQDLYALSIDEIAENEGGKKANIYKYIAIGKMGNRVRTTLESIGIDYYSIRDSRIVHMLSSIATKYPDDTTILREYAGKLKSFLDAGMSGEELRDAMSVSMPKRKTTPGTGKRMWQNGITFARKRGKIEVIYNKSLFKKSEVVPSLVERICEWIETEDHARSLDRELPAFLQKLKESSMS